MVFGPGRNEDARIGLGAANCLRLWKFPEASTWTSSVTLGLAQEARIDRDRMLDARVLHRDMAPKPLICSVATTDIIPSIDMTCSVAVTNTGDEVADALGSSTNESLGALFDVSTPSVRSDRSSCMARAATTSMHVRPKGALPGMCGFPGCPLVEKHSGLHQLSETAATLGKRQRASKTFQMGSNAKRPSLEPIFSSKYIETAVELRFSDMPPFGVVAPPEAAARFGNSLCCARNIALSTDLDELTESLIAQPKTLPWGSAQSSTQSRSRKKLIWLDEGSREQAAQLMTSGPNAAPRQKLAEELVANSSGDVRGSSLCSLGLANELRQCFEVDDVPLAFQPNFAHADFPLHYDLPGADGFGRSIITLNVKAKATILIEESLDHPQCRWRFELQPGDAWAMRGYARVRCAHGVSVMGIAVPTPCTAGCRACRVSLNLRCGAHDEGEVAEIERDWRASPEGAERM